MRGLILRTAIGLPLLLVGACSSDEELSPGAGPVLHRSSASSSILARAYANPTVGIGFWQVTQSPTGTRVWYGSPTCPWAGS